MALNLSRNSVYSKHQMEEVLFSAVDFNKGILMEGCSNKNLSGIGAHKKFEWEFENLRDCSREKAEKLSDNIMDLLPSDPFGMDFCTFTALSGWIEDMGNNLSKNPISFGIAQVESKKVEDRFLAELNLVWDSAAEIQKTSIRPNEQIRAGLWDTGFVFDHNIVDDVMGFCYEKYWIANDAGTVSQECPDISMDGSGGAPHDALFFAIGYLGVQDLLSVEMVCKSFHDAVRGDPLVWRNIHIKHPLSDKITDDSLLSLTSRAKGSLECLSLVECLKITETAVHHVLEQNPRMTKLSVVGCARVTVEGVLSSLKAVKSRGNPGIKKLRIGGIGGITDEHFNDLKCLLDADNCKQVSVPKPRFYSYGQLYLSCDDDRVIDIEACPRCQNLRQVYDCPAESCKGKYQTSESCKACTLCIARCINCGCCVDGCDYEETFCLDLICLDCWKQLLDCDASQEEVGIHFSEGTVFHQEARYLADKKSASAEQLERVSKFLQLAFPLYWRQGRKGTEYLDSWKAEIRVRF